METRRRLLNAAVPVALAALSVSAAVMAAAVMAAGAIDWTVGIIRLRSDSPDRSLLLGLAATVSLLLLRWRSSAWRRLGATLLVVSGILGLLTTRTGSTWPVGDGALIELCTLHAIQGHQLLGAYSQHGWHHPGPLSFYAFAPFYALGGYSTFGLAVGVLTVNLGSIGIIVWLTAAATGTRATFAVGLLAMFAVYAARVPQLLTSGWNPHTPMLPLVALTFSTAACVAGEIRLLPLVLFLASLVIQGHVGFAGVAGVLGAGAVAAVALTAWRHPPQRPAIGRWSLLSIVVMQAAWFIPLAEQVVHTPGNMTQIFRYFFSGDPGQSFAFAWRAWGTMLGGVFRPDFQLALGNRFIEATSLWPQTVGTIAVVALAPAALLAWRDGRRFMACLALACLGASVVGLWSVSRIPGLMGDYHIFWLSLIGVVNLSVVLGEASARLCRLVPEDVNLLAVRVATGLVLAGSIAVGGMLLMGSSPQPSPDSESADVEQLFAQLVTALPSTGSRRPIVRLDEGLWSVGAGLVLQMMRAKMAVSVAPEMLWLFGDSLAANGQEDVLLTVSRPGGHDAYARRTGNLPLARSERYFIDAVSLVDAPHYRP